MSATNSASEPEDRGVRRSGSSIGNRNDAGGPGVGRHDIVRRQREAYGGIKFGSCFFGWLTATGATVLLTALVAAAGAGVGLAKNVSASDVTTNHQSLGLAGAIALVVITFIGYLCGGYVAGRMARFNGVRQGIGVWVWALVIALVLGIVGLIAGNQYDVLARTNGFPRLPVNEGTLTSGGIIMAAALVLVSLIGAVLGGLLGMRFHRKVDRVSLDPVEPEV